MKKPLQKISLALIIVFFISFPISAFAEKWHPINIKLKKMYPADTMPYKWPKVPRVMPQFAFQLYQSGKALFVHIGHDGGNIPGAIPLSEKQAFKTNVAKLKKYAGKRYIITY